MNGLTLQSADWELQSSVQRVDDLIPGTYTAYATYTGTGYGTRATSYTNTAYYTGTVKKVSDGDVICSIVYRGEPLVPWAAIFAAVAAAGSGWRGCCNDSQRNHYCSGPGWLAGKAAE